eukprot:403370373
MADTTQADIIDNKQIQDPSNSTKQTTTLTTKYALEYLSQDLKHRLTTEQFTHVNQALTQQLQEQPQFIQFHSWLKANGAIYQETCDYPVAFCPQQFADQTENLSEIPYLIGVAAKKFIGPNEAYLYIPNKLIINEDKLYKSEYAQIFIDHPNEFKNTEKSDQTSLIFFVALELLKGEESYWHPYFETAQDSDLPQFWEDQNIDELEDALIKAELQMHQVDFIGDYEIAHGIANHYPDLVHAEKFTIEIYKRAYNIVTTRCFGWSCPSTCLVPFADCFNHFNLDNQYEIFNSDLHFKLRDYDPKKKVQEVGTYELEDQDYSYFTREKFNMNFFRNFQQEQREKQKQLGFRPIDQNSSSSSGSDESSSESNDDNDKKKTTYPVSTRNHLKCKNRARRLMIREECLKLTPKQFLEDDNYAMSQIWELKYESTSDEEDNDTSSESSSSSQSEQDTKIKEQDNENDDALKSDETQQTDDKKSQQDVQNPKKQGISFTFKDGQVIRTPLERGNKSNQKKNLIDLLVIQKNYLEDQESRMRQLQEQDENKYRKLVENVGENGEFDDLSESSDEDDEEFKWYKDQDQNTYFSLCTQYKTAYAKNTQMYHFYGRRTNRFLLLNYGFVLQDNKYNSITLRVYVTLNNKHFKEQADSSSQSKEIMQALGLEQRISKYLKLKKDKLNEDLLAYMRASLLSSYQGDKNHEFILISAPVEIKFEQQVLLSAITLLKNLLDNRFKTSMAEDIKLLAQEGLSNQTVSSTRYDFNSLQTRDEHKRLLYAPSGGF